MATLTKTSLREALHQKGVPVPPGSPKETLVRLYRKHFPGSDTARDGLLDFSSDEEADTQASMACQLGIGRCSVAGGLMTASHWRRVRNGARPVARVSVVGVGPLPRSLRCER